MGRIDSWTASRVESMPPETLSIWASLLSTAASETYCLNSTYKRSVIITLDCRLIFGRMDRTTFSARKGGRDIFTRKNYRV